MPNIYIIIVTYNAMKWAEKCFSSLRKSSIPLHCIIVDNGSTDGTQEFIKLQFPEVEIIQSPENLGFGKANNIGIETACRYGADFFYLMNQDAWIYEDSIQKLLDVYNNYPVKNEIGVLSPIHLDGSEHKLDVFFERYLARFSQENRIISDALIGTLKSFYELDFVNAAHWLIPITTVKAVGGFNPYFFHYSEDVEYVNRLNFHSKKILVCTESKVVHDGIQHFTKTDHINVKRVQREKRYLDPKNSFETSTIHKDFLPEIIKLFLKGKFSTSIQLFNEYKYQRKRLDEILDARKVLIQIGPSFLNINR